MNMPPTANLSEAILGIWMLKSREDVDDAGQIHIDPLLGPEPLGMLCFGPRHFSAQFMRRDRSSLPDTRASAEALNNSLAVNGYDGYFGTYSLDQAKGTLTTLLNASVSAENVGKTFVRDIRVVGNELFIQLQTTTTSGTPITRTNTFTRVS